MTHLKPETRRPKAIVALASLLVLSMFSSACGYSLLGRGSFLPTYIKTIGVPMFVNHSNFFNFENQLTEKVRAEFVSRGKYQILPDATNVDAVLIGEILSARIDPLAVSTGTSVNPNANANLQTSRAVTVTARVELRDVREDKPIWQNAAMTFREDFPTLSGTTVTDPNAFFGQDVNAMERISSDFARAIVSSILEAF